MFDLGEAGVCRVRLAHGRPLAFDRPSLMARQRKRRHTVLESIAAGWACFPVALVADLDLTFGHLCLQLTDAPIRSAIAGTNRPLLPFNKVTRSTTDAVYLLVNDERFAKCATARQARALAKLISEMAKASAAKRERLARNWINKQFAMDDAAARLSEGNAVIQPMRELSLILFLFLFVVSPVLVSSFGLMGLIIPVATVMVILAVLIGILFYRAHKQLFPAETSERFENLVKMILCPPVSMRAPDILTRNLLAEYSPIVLAGLLTGSSEQQFVRAFILDLQHPLKHEVSDETAEKTIGWTAAEQLNVCLEQVKAGQYLKPEDLLAPTQREDNTISYCPRCRCQFVVSADECPDCPGVALENF